MNVASMKPESTQAATSLDHLSWSGLNAYKQCPRRFKFRYIDKAPEERTASALLYGGAIHRAVERIHESRLSGEKVPSVVALLKEFEAAWEENAKQKPHISYSKGEDAPALRDLAQRTLSAYRKHVVESRVGRTEVLAIEEPARFQILKDGDAPPIEARLDLVEKSGDSIIITDFKTSRNSWNDAKIIEHLGQVVLYGHAVMPMVRDFNAKRVVTRFVVLTKGKSPKVQVLEPRPEQADVVRLKETVSDVWGGIKNNVFPRNESWACKNCPFRTVCLGQ